MENNNIIIINNDESLYKTIINNELKTGSYNQLIEEINGFIGYKFEKIVNDLKNDINNGHY